QLLSQLAHVLADQRLENGRQVEFFLFDQLLLLGAALAEVYLLLLAIIGNFRQMHCRRVGTFLAFHAGFLPASLGGTVRRGRTARIDRFGILPLQRRGVLCSTSGVLAVLLGAHSGGRGGVFDAPVVGALRGVEDSAPATRQLSSSFLMR